MTEHVSVVVVGASVAAAALVSSLRECGYEGRIVAVDHDPDMPYDRPPLSKEFLAGDEDLPEAHWWSDACELVRGTAQALDPSTRTVSVSSVSGEVAEFTADHVVIATGSSPVKLPGQPAGVVQLRTAADARNLRRHATPDRRVVILGAGTIGTELASSMAVAGAKVCLVDLGARPLDRFLAGHLGDEAAGWIRDAGVDLRLGTQVTGFQETAAGWLLETNHGPIEGDVVVSAIGTRPATVWLDGSDVAIADGLLCDASGRVLSRAGETLTGIHAIGDVANWLAPDGSRRRREDWTSAQRQGRNLALTIASVAPTEAISTEPDYFWSNQFGRRIQVLGTPTRNGRLVEQVADPDRNAAFYTVEDQGQTVAWISINRPREFALAMRQTVVSAL